MTDSSLQQGNVAMTTINSQVVSGKQTNTRRQTDFPPESKSFLLNFFND